jgi:2,5-diketo-D-gluconate reductase A
MIAGGKTIPMTTRANATTVPLLDLNDSNQIPQLGFGVFKVPLQDTADTVLQALEAGYRSIDTAAAYGNEAGVGDAIARSGLDRHDVFVTTKVWNDSHGRDAALRSFEHSLGQLGSDYVDLFLIHWPAPAQGKYVETWQALTELKADGRPRSIGVSNFAVDHLERIIDASGIVPAVNQIELHPRLQQAELRRFHADRGIATEAWSPLGRGKLLSDPVIESIASRLDRTPAQVVLRWHIQLGNVVIPKSVTPERIVENFRLFDFELSDEDMRAIGGLDAGERTGPDPATFG